MNDQMKTREKPTILIALGGNALIQKGQEGTIVQQFRNLRIPIRQIASLIEDYHIIITHGNGPQVGNLLLQQEACDEVPKLPLEILVAQTQGQIGYMIESVLDEALMEKGIDFQPICSLITYVVVNKNDTAFNHPTKPIGPIFTESQTHGLTYPIIETPKGFRRVVASPEPVTIIEKREIKQLIEMGFIVICCGGGGIPVVREGRAFNGIDAVLDKDLASECLADEVGVDVFLIATDVDGVMLNFGTESQRLLARVTPSEALEYERQGHFSTGAMLPKVRAASRFVKRTGNRALITHIESIAEAVSGKAGTTFVPD
jgi:carbamate kinase